MSDSQSSPDVTSHLDEFRYDDDIVRKFLAATLLWAIVSMLVGVIIAVQLAFPEVNFGVKWITFGRLRPLHTNAAIFAFAGNGVFAAVYYSTQRLCKVPYVERHAQPKLHFWGWQAIIVAAALTLPLGDHPDPRNTPSLSGRSTSRSLSSGSASSG